MTDASARTGLQIRSTVKKDGIVEMSLANVPTPEPKPDEVVVRIDAAPINPSDQGLLFAGADLTTAKASGTPNSPIVTASISAAVMKSMAGRRRLRCRGSISACAAGEAPATKAPAWSSRPGLHQPRRR